MEEDDSPLLEHEQEPDSVNDKDNNGGTYDITNVPPQPTPGEIIPPQPNQEQLNHTRDIQQLKEEIHGLETKLDDKINTKINAEKPTITQLENDLKLNSEKTVQIQQQVTNWKNLLLLIIILVATFLIIVGCIANYNLKHQITNLSWEKNQLFNQLNGFELIWRKNDPILETILDVKDLSIKVDILLSGVNQYSSVMIVGGLNAAITDTVIIYNSNIKIWENCQLKLPITIASHGAVLLKNEIYILGGYVDALQQSIPTVYKLEKNNQWTNVANMSTKRSGISQSAIVYNSEIWVIGGLNFNVTLNTVEKFNPETNVWQKMASMHYTRARAAATVINGKIYVSGGWDGNQAVNSVEVFDPAKNYWEIFKDLPHDRIWDKPLSSHASLTDRTNLIIIGGEITESSPTNAVWKINVSDPKAEWIRMASLVQGRYYHGAVKLKDQMMVIGGMDSSKKKLNSVEMFDGSNWTAGPKLPIELTAFATIPLTKKYEEVILNKYKCSS